MEKYVPQTIVLDYFVFVDSRTDSDRAWIRVAAEYINCLIDLLPMNRLL
jgi:hypothetical protein